MSSKIESQRIPKRQKETENKPESPKIAETLGKFNKMSAKNGDGDKAGLYGSRG